MRKTDILRQLQDVDSRIDATRTAISTLEGQLGVRDALTAREAEIEAIRTELHSIAAEQRDLELQADERRGKITTDETKLYGGRVTNPKELQNLQEEVAQDKRQLGTVEDQLLVLLERSEELTNRLNELNALYQQESDAWNAEQATATKKLETAKAGLAAAEGQRTKTASQIGPAELSTYETIRRQKGGVAVAQVQQRTCQSCRVSLTANQEQRARIGADVVLCHSCGRILYVALT